MNKHLHLVDHRDLSTIMVFAAIQEGNCEVHVQTAWKTLTWEAATFKLLLAISYNHAMDFSIV
jgi:hypothetical protein